MDEKRILKKVHLPSKLYDVWLKELVLYLQDQDALCQLFKSNDIEEDNFLLCNVFFVRKGARMEITLPKLYVVISEAEYKRLCKFMEGCARVFDPLYDKMGYLPQLVLKGIPLFTKAQMRFLKGVKTE